MVQLSLGIDFGTTTTSVAVREPGLLPEVLPIGENELLYMPSAVAFLPQADGSYQTLIGEDAQRAGQGAELITSIKRCFNCDGSRCQSNHVGAAHLRTQKWPVSNSGRCHAGQIQAGGRQWPPEEIAFLIVEEALKRAFRTLKDRYSSLDGLDLRLSQANFGCSTVSNLAQRQMMLKIARRLGFDNVRLANVIEEPIAAGVGFAYLEDLQPGRTLIYDFGGGTFDAAVVDVNRGATKVAVLASGGVQYLGGDDIDAMIMDYLLEQIGLETGYAADEIRELLQPGLDERMLRTQAERAKLELSEFHETEVVLPLSLRDRPFTIALSRVALERLIASERRFDKQPLVERSTRCVADVLRKAKVYSHRRESGGTINKEALLREDLQALIKEVDYVLLVGGVTKMPYVRNELSKTFGSHRIFEGFMIDDPVTAVAKGAALDKEYQNLVLPAPPYSIVAEPHTLGGAANPITLYSAYDVLWPNQYSHSRADFRYIGDPEPVLGVVTVGLLQPDSGEFHELGQFASQGYLRVDIDESAGIYLLTGPSPGNMTTVFSKVAPWQHEVQIIPVASTQPRGHLYDDPKTILLSN
jgi:molecular chaperone DnaK